MSGSVNKVGFGQYEVHVRAEPFSFRYDLSGGVFSSSKGALRAAQELANMSRYIFQTSDLIKTVFSNHKPSGNHLDSRRAEWIRQALLLRELAMMVPPSHNEYRTGSNGITQKNFNQTLIFCYNARTHFVNNAPGTYEDDKTFLQKWGKFILEEHFDLEPITRNRIENRPAILGIDEGGEEYLREEAIRIGTRHLSTRIPVLTNNTGMIRGDKALSLVNMMTPQIRGKIDALPDGPEKEDLMERISAIHNKAEEASKKRRNNLSMEDVRLSLDVLEQQVDVRIEDEGGPGLT